LIKADSDLEMKKTMTDLGQEVIALMVKGDSELEMGIHLTVPTTYLVLMVGHQIKVKVGLDMRAPMIKASTDLGMMLNLIKADMD